MKINSWKLVTQGHLKSKQMTLNVGIYSKLFLTWEFCKICCCFLLFCCGTGGNIICDGACCTDTNCCTPAICWTRTPWNCVLLIVIPGLLRTNPPKSVLMEAVVRDEVELLEEELEFDVEAELLLLLFWFCSWLFPEFNWTSRTKRSFADLAASSWFCWISKAWSFLLSRKSSMFNSETPGWVCWSKLKFQNQEYVIGVYQI